MTVVPWVDLVDSILSEYVGGVFFFVHFFVEGRNRNLKEQSATLLIKHQQLVGMSKKATESR